MRIVLFIGSPVVSIDTAELIKIAKKLKKEKVHCDVIIFGEGEEENGAKFSQFVDTLNGKEGTGSNLLVIPAGSTLSDVLASSAVCRNEDGSSAPGGGGFDFGVDAENDPDLALALRVSMEEERARQAAEAAANGGTANAEPQVEPVAQAMDVDMSTMTEEQQLEWALRLSMQESVPRASESEAANSGNDEKMEVDVTGTTTPDNIDDLMNNPDLLQQIVDDLPNEEKNQSPDEKDKGSK
ncbi:unnamed protein product [Caenorhabditis auriculariae]|uniref:26S proteasome non-ATPase regulatory subunit 4 n=1 Tax=Caenorhabditis auriculariae TaxID=2777116 RepID=A0A8S1GMB3_9PELO|nr:unnamed protein product [Caenorhabditis auriculariae]